MAKQKGLTAADEMFIAMYFECNCKPTEAYKKLHPKSKCPQSHARYLMNKPLIQEAIARRATEAMDYSKVVPKDVIKSLYENLMADVTQAYNDDWTLKDPDKIPEVVRRAIESINVTDKGASVKKTNIKGLLELLGKVAAMYTDKVKDTTDEDMANRILEGRNRVGNIISDN